MLTQILQSMFCITSTMVFLLHDTHLISQVLFITVPKLHTIKVWSNIKRVDLVYLVNLRTSCFQPQIAKNIRKFSYSSKTIRSKKKVSFQMNSLVNRTSSDLTPKKGYGRNVYEFSPRWHFDLYRLYQFSIFILFWMLKSFGQPARPLADKSSVHKQERVEQLTRSTMEPCMKLFMMLLFIGCNSSMVYPGKYHWETFSD